MKKATITNKNMTFVKFMELSKDGLLMVVYNHNHRPAGLSTLGELCAKYKLSEATVKIYRGMQISFPHPVAIQQGNPNLTYLYSDKDFAAWVDSWASKKNDRRAKKLVEMERMIQQARKLERKAYALRQKTRGFNIQITEGDK
jgi:hypothetical protein